MAVLFGELEARQKGVGELRSAKLRYSLSFGAAYPNSTQRLGAGIVMTVYEDLSLDESRLMASVRLWPRLTRSE